MSSPQHTTVKSFTMASIAKNPKLARQISDGLNAPIGSTKRAQAKELMKVIKKMTGLKFPGMADGQGGNPTDPKQGSMNPVERNSFTNTRFFPAAPDFSDKFRSSSEASKGITSSYAGGKQDGQGGYDPSIGFLGNAWEGLKVGSQYLDKGKQVGYDIGKAVAGAELGVPEWIKGNALGKKDWNDTQGAQIMKSVYDKYFPNDVAKVNTRIEDPSNYFKNLQKSPFSYINLNKNITNTDGTKAAPGMSTKPADVKFIEKYKGKPAGFFEWTGTKDAMGRNQYAYINPDGSLKIGYENDSAASPYGSFADSQKKPGDTPNGNGAVNGPVDQYGEDFGWMTSAQKSQYRSVLDAIKAKTGAAGFAMATINDKAAFKKLFPGVPDDQIPYNLAAHMKDIQTALEKENHLDTLLNQRTDVLNRDGSFQKEMENYVRGRDSYIEDIDKLIDKTKAGMYNGKTALSDFAQNSNNNELNYLYSLKGRQNQRYADFIGDAITQQGQYIQSIDSQYTNAVTKYNADITTAREITAADYDKWYNALSAMYQAIDTAPDTMIAREQTLATYQATVLGGVADGTGLVKKTTPEQIRLYQDQILDKDSKLVPGTDVFATLNRLVNEGFNGNAAVETISKGIANSIKSATNVQDINKYIEDINGINKQYGPQSVLNTQAKDATKTGLNNLLSQVNVTDLGKKLDGAGWGGKTEKNDKAGFKAKAEAVGIKDYDLMDLLYNYWVNDKSASNTAMFSNPGTVAAGVAQVLFPGL